MVAYKNYWDKYNNVNKPVYANNNYPLFLRLTSVDTPSLLHRYSIASPSFRWSIYGEVMEKRWRSDGETSKIERKKTQGRTSLQRRNLQIHLELSKKYVILHATNEKLHEEAIIKKISNSRILDKKRKRIYPFLQGGKIRFLIIKHLITYHSYDR